MKIRWAGPLPALCFSFLEQRHPGAAEASFLRFDQPAVDEIRHGQRALPDAVDRGGDPGFIHQRYSTYQTDPSSDQIGDDAVGDQEAIVGQPHPAFVVIKVSRPNVAA